MPTEPIITDAKTADGVPFIKVNGPLYHLSVSRNGGEVRILNDWSVSQSRKPGSGVEYTQYEIQVWSGGGSQVITTLYAAKAAAYKALADQLFKMATVAIEEAAKPA